MFEFSADAGYVVMGSVIQEVKTANIAREVSLIEKKIKFLYLLIAIAILICYDALLDCHYLQHNTLNTTLCLICTIMVKLI